MGRAVGWEWGLGLGLGAAIGWLGQRGGLLSRGGMVGVAAVVALGFGAGGWVWGVLLLVVMVSSGLWSRYRGAYKATLVERASGSTARDCSGVLAGMGWAAVLTLLHLLAPGVAGVFAAFLGALATTNADVWATELGLLSSPRPRLITTGRPVPQGTSGAVSILGIVAALAGSWLVGFMGLFLVAIRAQFRDLTWDRSQLWLPLAAASGGMVGNLVDSLLGAAAQGIYYCEHCDAETDQRVHSCGRQARQVRGWAWLTSDGVDLVSSIVGAAAAAGVAASLAQTSIWW